jgi:mRNA interferase YafQ
MLDLQLTNQFKRDYKKLKKQGKNTAKIFYVLDKIRANITLDPKYNDHQLTGI